MARDDDFGSDFHRPASIRGGGAVQPRPRPRNAARGPRVKTSRVIMKPRIYLVAAALIVAIGSLPFLAGAQLIVTADGKKSDEIMTKIHKMDMVNQLLPVLMTTDQVKAILGPIEVARQ